MDAMMTVDEFLDEDTRGIMFLGKHRYDAFFVSIGSERHRMRERDFWRECLKAYRVGRLAGYMFRFAEILHDRTLVACHSQTRTKVLAERRAMLPEAMLLGARRSVARGLCLGENRR